MGAKVWPFALACGRIVRFLKLVSISKLQAYAVWSMTYRQLPTADWAWLSIWRCGLLSIYDSSNRPESHAVERIDYDFTDKTRRLV